MKKLSFPKFSLTYKGVMVFVAGYVFSMAGVPFVEGNIEITIVTITDFIGACMILYGRWRAGGLTAFGFRKKAK